VSFRRPNGPIWRGCRSRAVPGAALCVAALTVACASAANSEPPYALIGQSAPDFALHAVAAGNVRLSEHRGQVVVLSFWGSHCGTCRTQLTALDRSFTTYRSAGLAVYGVDVDDDPAGALDFAHSASLSFALLLDPAKAVARSYQVDNLPMTVLIDRNGTVRYVLREFNRANDALYLQQLHLLLDE